LIQFGLYLQLILTFLVFGLFWRWLRQLKIKENESNDQKEERIIVIPKRLVIYENDLGEETDDDMLEDWNYQRRARREERRFKEDSFELERTIRKIDRCEKELLSLLNERKAQEESIIPGLKKHIRRKNRKQEQEANNSVAEDRDGSLTAF